MLVISGYQYLLGILNIVDLLDIQERSGRPLSRSGVMYET